MSSRPVGLVLVPRRGRKHFRPGSGLDGGDGSIPDASTGRTEAGGSDAGGSRAGSGSAPAEVGDVGSTGGSHAGDGKANSEGEPEPTNRDGSDTDT